MNEDKSNNMIVNIQENQNKTVNQSNKFKK